jgi:hypothetical protein
MNVATYRFVIDMTQYPAAPGLTAVLQDIFLNTERTLKFGDTSRINFNVTSNAASAGLRFRIVFRRVQVQTAPFTQIQPICRGEAINLPATSTNGIKGTWTPAVNNTQTTTYTFVPSEGQCATTQTMTVQVNQPITPTFTQINPVCKGGTITLPTTSNNSISGSWLPAINNKETTTYTFTPASGLCATTQTMTVQVNERVTPTFTYGTSLIICAGDPTPNLQAISTNNIVGLWNPANVSNTQSDVYTFTPAPSACATTATFSVTVNQPVIPQFTQLGPFDPGTTFTLPSTSNNNISGGWSPAINNIQTTTYTFMPTVGQCASPVQMTILINNFPTSVFDINTDSYYRVYPNPLVKGSAMQLMLRNRAAGKYIVTLFTITGIRVQQDIIGHAGGTAIQSLKLSNNLVSGTYIAEISSANGVSEKVKVVVE